MCENEVIADLSDLRVELWAAYEQEVLREDVFYNLLNKLDEKMEKYRDKQIIIKCGWSE